MMKKNDVKSFHGVCMDCEWGKKIRTCEGDGD